MTRGELITELAAFLGARHEARFIVEDVLGPAPYPAGADHGGDVGADIGADIGADALDAAHAMAARRRAGEPLQYVLGHWAFRALDLLVDERVLIPRPETEEVVDVALRELDRSGAVAPRIVDAGTGSGAIALAVATELAERHPGGRVWATDTSAAALTLARANLDRVTLQTGGAVLPLTFAQGSWLSPLPGELEGTIDLIVSNPPYIAAAEWPRLPAEVRREPVGALVAEDGTDGTPGLRDVEEVLSQAWTWLARHGSVVVEIAPAQAEPAAAMARSVGFRHVRVETDMAQRPRALVGRTR